QNILGHLLSGHGPRSRCLAALCQSATYGAQGSRPVAWWSRAQERRLRSTAQITRQRRRSLTDKHLQCVEQRLRIILTLIDGPRLSRTWIACQAERTEHSMVKAISLGTSTYWPMSPRLVAPSGTGGGMSPRLQGSQTLLT